MTAEEKQGTNEGTRSSLSPCSKLCCAIFHLLVHAGFDIPVLLLAPSTSGGVSVSRVGSVKGSGVAQLVFPYGFLFCRHVPRASAWQGRAVHSAQELQAPPLSAASSQACHPGHPSVCCTNPASLPLCLWQLAPSPPLGEMSLQITNITCA